MRLSWSKPSKRRWRLSLALGLLLAAPAGAAEQTVAKLGDQALSIDSAEGKGTLLAFASQPLLGRMPGVTRLLVMVHGAGRDGDQALALGRGVLGPEAAHTLVVAPQFLNQADAKRWSLPSDRLRWAGAGWADGLAAAGPRPVSPFSALDSLLRSLADPGLLPDLKSIVLAGQGEGADLVQLYAATTTHLDGLQKRGLSIRFVLAEPVHYLYLDQARPAPADAASCPGFNRWPYGLDGAPNYLAEIGPASIFNQYQTRDVVYLLGEPGLQAEPSGCETAAQGPDRAARGRFYASYMAKLAGAPVQHLAAVAKAEAGHGLLASACGTAALLGRADCPALAAAPDLPAFPEAAAKPPADAAVPAAAKVEPPKPEPPKPEPAKPEPTTADPAPAAAPSGPAPATEALPPPDPAKPDQAKPDQAKPDPAAPDGLADPLHDANPIGPLLTRPPPPAPRPAPPKPPQ